MGAGEFLAAVLPWFGAAIVLVLAAGVVAVIVWLVWLCLRSMLDGVKEGWRSGRAGDD